MLEEKFANNDKSSGTSSSPLHDVDFELSRDIFSSRKVQDRSVNSDSNVLSFGTNHLYGDNRTSNDLSNRANNLDHKNTGDGKGSTRETANGGDPNQPLQQDLKKIEEELASLMTWLEQRGVKLPPR